MSVAGIFLLGMKTGSPRGEGRISAHPGKGAARVSRLPPRAAGGILAACLLAPIAGAERIRLGAPSTALSRAVVLSTATASAAGKSGDEGPAASPAAVRAATPLFLVFDAAELSRLTDVPVAFETDGYPGQEDRLADLLKGHPQIESILLDVRGTGSLSPGENLDREIFFVKKVTSMIRGLRPDVKIALAGGGSAAPDVLARMRTLLSDPTILADVDAVAVGNAAVADLAAAPLAPSVSLWLEEPVSPGAAPASLVEGLRRIEETRAARYFYGAGVDASFSAELARAQAYLTDDVSPQPAGPDPSEARFYDGRTLSPILFMRGAVEISKRLSVTTGGPYREAQVENLSTGARRIFPLGPGARSLDLDLTRGALAVRFIPERKPGEVQTRVTVGGTRGLTADEIVARERAWKATQDDLVHRYSADLSTSLRFRVAEINETFDLTIQGPLFKERGKEFDWEWDTSTSMASGGRERRFRRSPSCSRTRSRRFRSRSSSPRTTPTRSPAEPSSTEGRPTRSISRRR